MALDSSILINGTNIIVSSADPTIITIATPGAALGLIEMVFSGCQVLTVGQNVLYDISDSISFKNNSATYTIVPINKILLTYIGIVP